MADAPEIEWARRLLNGDSSALAPLMESIQQKVFLHAWLVCGQREDAEEVAQETLLRVFESFEQLQNPERVRTWAFRIAKNFCLMKRRKSTFAPCEELSLDEPSSLNGGAGAGMQIRDETELPELRLLRSEMNHQLGAALRELPYSYSSVVLLRDLEGLSTAETAEVLDLSEDAVKQRLHRGRSALRKKLEAYVRPVTESRLTSPV